MKFLVKRSAAENTIYFKKFSYFKLLQLVEKQRLHKVSQELNLESKYIYMYPSS